MIGIKEINETRKLTRSNKKRTKQNMTAYFNVIRPVSRPLPLAEPGQTFTDEEKRQADKAWREKYHITEKSGV